MVGRAAELGAVAEALASGERLLTITGPPGVGKTRLARHVAAAEPPDRVVFCDLTPARSLDDAAGAVGAALGITLRRGRGDDGIAQALAARGPVLLVLDNAERLAGAAAVARWLDEAPEARALVTSRRRLGVDGERCIALAPLPPGDAIALYREHARRVRGRAAPAADDDAIAELVDRLDRVPLAIELTAARSDVLPPATLLERLPQRLAVLRGPPGGRHRSLHDAIAVSWELLDPAARAALARCAVFEGSFALAAAEAVIDARGRGPTALERLAALAEASLVEAVDDGDARFRLLESVRAFAGAELDRGGGRAAAEARHDAWVLAEGEAQAARVDGPDELEALRRLGLERHNLLAVLRRNLAPAPALAARAARALHAFVALRQPGARELALLDQGLDAAARARKPALRAPLVVRRAIAAYRLGRPDEAREGFDEAIALARRIRDRATLALAHLFSGGLHLDLGDVDAATADQARAAALFRELGDVGGQGRAANLEGRIAEARGDLAASARHFERALALHRRSGSLRLEAVALGNLGVVRHGEGRLEDARALFEEALALHRRIGDRGLEANNLVNLGTVLVTAGRVDEGEVHLRDGLALERAAGNRRFEGLAVANLAIAAHLRGELRDALALYQQALALLRACGEHQFSAVTLPFFAACEAELGLAAEAQADLAAARRAQRRLGDPGTLVVADVLEGVVDPSLATARLARGEALLRDREDGAVRASELPIAVRLLRRAVAARAGRAAPAGAVEIGPDHAWFRIGDAPPVDLTKHGALRRIVAALVAARRASPGVALSADDLFAAGWPGERARPDAAAGRVYTAVRTLRRRGLDAVLVRREQGYLLDEAVPLTP